MRLSVYEESFKIIKVLFNRVSGGCLRVLIVV